MFVSLSLEHGASKIPVMSWYCDKGQNESSEQHFPWEQERIYPRLCRETEDAIKMHSDTPVENKHNISSASLTSFLDIMFFSVNLCSTSQ